MAQAHEDPTLHDLDGRLDLGLVLRMAGPRRQHRSAVVTREVLHRVVGPRLVAVRARDHRARVVGDDELRHATDEAQGACASLQPVDHGLAWRGPDEGVAGRAERGHKDVGPIAIGELDRRAGVVDEELLAGAVDLAHRALQPQRIAPIPLAELAVAVGRLPGVGRDVLLPQQHEGHALAPQLLVHAAVVRQHVVRGTVQPALHDTTLQRRVAERLNDGPVQARDAGKADVLGHDALGDAE